MSETVEPGQEQEPEEQEPGESEPTPEEQEQEEADESEQAPQPEAPASEPETSAMLAKRDKALDGLQTHVRKRLETILGDDAIGYTPCEICTAYGTPGWRIGGDLPPEVKVVVSHAMGLQTVSSLRQAKDTARCEACDGKGYCATGSDVPDFEAAMCLDCNGRGWVATDERRRSLVGGAPNGQAPLVPATPGAGTPDYNPAIPEPPEAAQLRAMGYAVFAPPQLGA